MPNCRNAAQQPCHLPEDKRFWCSDCFKKVDCYICNIGFSDDPDELAATSFLCHGCATMFHLPCYDLCVHPKHLCPGCNVESDEDDEDVKKQHEDLLYAIENRMYTAEGLRLCIADPPLTDVPQKYDQDAVTEYLVTQRGKEHGDIHWPLVTRAAVTPVTGAGRGVGGRRGRGPGGVTHGRAGGPELFSKLGGRRGRGA